jgi:4-hydroxy-2-oxoheptanedioate aldolase
MTINTAKTKMLAGKPAIGGAAGLGSPLGAEILALAGLDLVMIDDQHGIWEPESMMAAFRSVRVAGSVPMARVGKNDFYAIGAMLDRGALGIVVPMVDTVEQAKTAIAAAKYPPVGNRSVGGGMHPMNFGTASSQEYYAKVSDEILVVLQTESPQGVENAEAIYSLPGCDAIFIGPVDLRFQMRAVDGTFPTPEEHEAMVQRVIQAGKEVGTPTGIHAMDAESALERARQGMQFIAVGSDLRLMTQKAQEQVRILYPEGTGKEVARY